METSTRLEGIGEYYFSQKLREIDTLNREGRDIINLGIGSPDLPPHPSVIEELQLQAAKPNTHAYQNYKGSPVLRKAIADWYANWYQVNLDPDTEILPLIGSKEGIMHICMSYLNAGDVALVPDPGYPTYSSAVKLAGGSVSTYTLSASNRWAPEIDTLEQLIQNVGKRVKLLFVNFPHMPTGSLPSESLFERLIELAKRHNILIVHDNPYSFILNEQPASMLSVAGAREVVVELNSLSKSHNMAGWRVGMLCGAAARIIDVIRFKSNMDSGMFLPVQLAAAKALSLGKDWFEKLNAHYRERRQRVYELLDILGCSYTKDQAGMFVWAEKSPASESGYALSDKILYGASVFITPGGIFGKAGEQYIRISLCTPVEKLDAAIERVRNFIQLNGLIAG